MAKWVLFEQFHAHGFGRNQFRTTTKIINRNLRFCFYFEYMDWCCFYVAANQIRRNWVANQQSMAARTLIGVAHKIIGAH